MKTPKNPTIIDDTITFWQRKAGVTLDEEEARQAVENVVGFFTILQEWADAEHDEKKTCQKSSNSHT